MASRGPITTADPGPRPGGPTDYGPRDRRGYFDPGNRQDTGGGGGDDELPTSSSIAPPRRAWEPRSRTLTVGAAGRDLWPIYGEVETGALFPYGVGKGNYLYSQYFLGEGPIYSADEFGYGDSPAMSFKVLGLVEGIDYNVYLGTHDQAIDPIMVGAVGVGVWKWRFPRIAWVSVRLNLGLPAFDNVDPMAFRCRVRGLLVNDHRIDGTMDYEDRAYSDNAALCTADFMRSDLFGLGAADEELDFDTVDEAADDCDEVIATFDGTAPSTAPTVAVGITTGRIEAGTWRYGYTLIDAAGVESTISSASADVVLTAASTHSVQVSAMADTGSSSVWIQIYRSRKTGSTYGAWKRIPISLPGLPVASGLSGVTDTSSSGELGGGPPISNDVALFRIATKLDRDELVADTLNLLRGNFTAAIVYNNGRYQIYVDKPRTATDIVYTAADIVPGSLSIRYADPSESPSQIFVHFFNSSKGFKPDEAAYPPQTETTGLERQDRIIQSESADACPGYSQAYTIAKWRWDRQVAAGVEYAWRTGQRGALPLPLSRVGLANALRGLPLTGVVMAACGPDSRDTWAMKAENEVELDTDYHADPGTDTPTIDPPPPGEPPAPSDNYILKFGAHLGHVGPLPE